MKSVTEHIRESLLLKAGLTDPPPVRYTLEELYDTQWSEEFEQLMRNRLVMGALRYGTFKEQRKQNKRYNTMGSCIKRLNLYLKTGNQEHLVDTANLCMVEYVNGYCHKSPWFKAVDDGGHVNEY